MAAIVVRRLTGPWKRNGIGSREPNYPTRNRKHPKMEFVCGELVVTVPFAPKEASHTGLSSMWTETARPGREPLVTFSAPGLQKIAYSIPVSHTLRENWTAGSIEYWLSQLTDMSNQAEPITIRNGPGAGGRWRMTGLSINVIERAHMTNAIERCTVDIELTKATFLTNKPGPVQGGKTAAPTSTTQTAPSRTATVAPLTKKSVAARYYVVKSGDTLSKISNRYYRTPSKWKDIAVANGIRNPNLIMPGKKLRIP